MKRIEHYVLLSLVVIFGGCATAGGPSMIEDAVVTRDFAGPETILTPLPTSIVLLRRNDPRNDDICEGFLGDLEATDTALQADPFGNYIRTFWILETNRVPTDCDDAITNYDFERAREIGRRFDIEAMPAFLLISPNGQEALKMTGDELTEEDAKSFAERWLFKVGSAELKPADHRSAWATIGCGLLSLVSEFAGGDGGPVASWFGERIPACAGEFPND